MDFNNGQIQGQPDECVDASEPTSRASVQSGFGIADVLFPANPPTPVNARLVRGVSFHDDNKPRGLGRSAELRRPAWDPWDN